MNFHYLGHFNQLLYKSLNFHNLYCLIPLRNRLFNVLYSFHYFLLNDRHLHLSLHLLNDFSYERHYFLNGLFYLLHSILVNNFLLNYFDLLYCWNFHPYLYYLFNDLRHLLYLLNCLNYGNYFLHDPLYDLRHLFNVVYYFLSRLIVYCIHQFLYDLLYFNDNWLLDDSLHYLLHNDFHFLDLLDRLLYHHCLLPYYLHLFYLRHCLIHYSFHNDWLLDFYYFLFDDFHLNELWHLHSLLNNFLHYSRHLDYFLFDLLYLHYLLDDPVDILDHFNWNMDHLLYLLYLSIINYLFNNFLDGHHNGHFNYPIHNFFNNLRDLHYLVVYLESLENVIN